MEEGVDNVHGGMRLFVPPLKRATNRVKDVVSLPAVVGEMWRGSGSRDPVGKRQCRAGVRCRVVGPSLNGCTLLMLCLDVGGAAFSDGGKCRDRAAAVGSLTPEV